jgi:hypothetical protein
MEIGQGGFGLKLEFFILIVLFVSGNLFAIMVALPCEIVVASIVTAG